MVSTGTDIHLVQKKATIITKILINAHIRFLQILRNMYEEYNSDEKLEKFRAFYQYCANQIEINKKALKSKTVK